MKLKLLVLMTILLVLTKWSIAQAEPTQVAKNINYEHSGEKLDGVIIYYAMENETQPRFYDDSRSIDITDASLRSVLLLTVMASPSGPMCFRLTAYSKPSDTAYESGFSDEVCGFFGFESLMNVSIE